MIRHSPAELYVKYLVCHPDGYTTDAIRDIVRGQDLDYPSDDYVDRIGTHESDTLVICAHVDPSKLDTAIVGPSGAREFPGLDGQIPKFPELILRSPSRPPASIRFSLRRESHVSLAAYNSRGGLVKQLLDKPLPEGTYVLTWSDIAVSGVYFVRLTTSLAQVTKRLLIVR